VLCCAAIPAVAETHGGGMISRSTRRGAPALSSGSSPTHPGHGFVPEEGRGSAPTDPRPSGRAADAAAAPAEPPLDLERVRQRDPEALSAFFDRYFPQVYGLVHRLLGNRAQAEDAAQETWLKVYRSLHTLDPGRDPGPWLTTIAANTCRDLWRSGAFRMGLRSRDVDDPAVAERLVSPAPDPERHALASERERLVQEALARLPDPLRLVIVLHDWQGVGHPEIAEMLGLSHDAARKRYSRALAALARELEGKLS
jgi:RNA polymerase sigma-70 factor (ECF subfamily)